jgi:hypothetical protein
MRAGHDASLSGKHTWRAIHSVKSISGAPRIRHQSRSILAPIASEVLLRIAAFHAIEADIRGPSTHELAGANGSRLHRMIDPPGLQGFNQVRGQAPLPSAPASWSAPWAVVP